MNLLVTIAAATAAGVSALFASSALADETIDLNRVPPPVRATIEREAADGSIEELLDLTDDGQLFKVEIEKDGQEHELYVDASGRVVGRVLD